MTEALISVLCQEGEWCFDTEGRTIKFNKDGTGELLCRCNFNYWIAAELEWKTINNPRSEAFQSPASGQDDDSQNGKMMPQIIGQLDIEMTLTKRLPSWARDSVVSKCTTLNERILTDDAFKPKPNTVRVESGNFIAPCYVGSSSSSDSDATTAPRYANRIVFDKSPYPAQSEWKTTDGGPEDGKFWDHREFVSGLSSDLARQGPPMNDPSAAAKGGSSSCVVS